MHKLLAAALVCALAIASPAQAKDRNYLGGFDKFDADKDGSITLAETKAFYKASKKKAKRLKQAPAIFARWDADEDGKVTKDEYAAYAKSKAKDGGKKKKPKPAKDEETDADEE